MKALPSYFTLSMFALQAVAASSSFLCNDDTDCLPSGTCGPALACICNTGYYGDQCDRSCPISCQNGGQCRQDNDHGGLAVASEYTCDCPEGRGGSLCQGNCRSDPDCLNGGQCQISNGTCLCKSGFTGHTCELSCPILCENGGQCRLKENEHGGYELEDMYACECPIPFTGSLCRDSSAQGSLSNPQSGTAKENENVSRVVVLGILAGVLTCILFSIFIRIQILRTRRIPKESSKRQETSLEEDGLQRVEKGCCDPPSNGQQATAPVPETTADGAALPYVS